MGFAGIFVAMSGLMGPIIAKFVVHKKEDYLYLFIIGAGLCCISLIVCLLFKEERFKYGNNKIKDNKEEAIIINKIDSKASSFDQTAIDEDTT